MLLLEGVFSALMSYQIAFKGRLSEWKRSLCRLSISFFTVYRHDARILPSWSYNLCDNLLTFRLIVCPGL